MAGQVPLAVMAGCPRCNRQRGSHSSPEEDSAAQDCRTTQLQQVSHWYMCNAHGSAHRCRVSQGQWLCLARRNSLHRLSVSNPTQLSAMCHEVHMVLTLALWDGCSCMVALYLITYVHGMIWPYNLCSCTSSPLNMARCVSVTSKLPLPALDQSCMTQVLRPRSVTMLFPLLQ